MTKYGLNNCFFHFKYLSGPHCYNLNWKKALLGISCCQHDTKVSAVSARQ